MAGSSWPAYHLGVKIARLKFRSALDGPPKSLRDRVSLIWTDPPFGTGKEQKQGGHSFFDPAEIGYVIEGLTAWLPALAPDGVLCVCLDYRAIHDVVVAMKNEGLAHRGDVEWGFGLGRPRTSWWPVRHNTIATFTRGPETGRFYADRAPREDRLAPKAGYASDKPAGSIWWKTLSNTDPERVGYPNQKPIAIIEPFVLCHTDVGDLVVDPFMGSASTGAAALRNDRKFYGCDTNKQAIRVAHERLTGGTGWWLSNPL